MIQLSSFALHRRRNYITFYNRSIKKIQFPRFFDKVEFLVKVQDGGILFSK